MESTTTSKASARYAHRRFTHLDFSSRAFAALYSHIYTVVAMVDLDAIEQRVRATICETKGKDVIERIISEDDFEALMRAARGLEASSLISGGHEEIEQRVRATVCRTFSARGMTLEGRISEADLNTLLDTVRAQTKSRAEALVVLRKFRDFVTREATQWTLNGSHHNPIWQRVAEALDTVGLNDVPICRVCDALDREHAWASSNLCTVCAQAIGGGIIVEQSSAVSVTVSTGVDGGANFPCAYPDCECDDGTGPCWHMRDAGHTTFPKI